MYCMMYSRISGSSDCSRLRRNCGRKTKAASLHESHDVIYVVFDLLVFRKVFLYPTWCMFNVFYVP